MQYTYAAVLCNELKKKFPAHFASYIDADFLASVMLFNAPSSVVGPCLRFDRIFTPLNSGG